MAVRAPSWFRPSRTVPLFAWGSQGSRWAIRPANVLILWAGLWIYGIGEAALIDAHLGNTPWTVLAEGLHRHTGLSIGALTILIGAVMFLGWYPLGQRPGFGSISNVILIGVSIDVMSPLMPRPTSVTAQLVQVVVGIVLGGLGCALYLSTHLGPGPRDGWMLGLHQRFGWPIFWVRLAIEAGALGFGVLLGGTVGVATLIFTFTIGHMVALWMTALHAIDSATSRSPQLAYGNHSVSDIGTQVREVTGREAPDELWSGET